MTDMTLINSCVQNAFYLQGVFSMTKLLTLGHKLYIDFYRFPVLLSIRKSKFSMDLDEE